MHKRLLKSIYFVILQSRYTQKKIDILLFVFLPAQIEIMSDHKKKQIESILEEKSSFFRGIQSLIISICSSWAEI